MSTEAIYTQEQMDIALIKNTQEGIIRTIGNLEIDLKGQFSEFKSEMKGQLSEFKSEMKGQFHLLLTLILGIYAMIGAAALGKIFGIL